jgi:hypothetical protein
VGGELSWEARPLGPTLDHEADVLGCHGPAP